MNRLTTFILLFTLLNLPLQKSSAQNLKSSNFRISKSQAFDNDYQGFRRVFADDNSTYYIGSDSKRVSIKKFNSNLRLVVTEDLSEYLPEKCTLYDAIRFRDLIVITYHFKDKTKRQNCIGILSLNTTDLSEHKQYDDAQCFPLKGEIMHYPRLFVSRDDSSLGLAYVYKYYDKSIRKTRSYVSGLTFDRELSIRESGTVTQKFTDFLTYHELNYLIGTDASIRFIKSEIFSRNNRDMYFRLDLETETLDSFTVDLGDYYVVDGKLAEDESGELIYTGTCSSLPNASTTHLFVSFIDDEMSELYDLAAIPLNINQLLQGYDDREVKGYLGKGIKNGISDGKYKVTMVEAKDDQIYLVAEIDRDFNGKYCFRGDVLLASFGYGGELLWSHKIHKSEENPGDYDIIGSHACMLNHKTYVWFVTEPSEVVSPEFKGNQNGKHFFECSVDSLGKLEITNLGKISTNLQSPMCLDASNSSNSAVFYSDIKVSKNAYIWRFDKK